MVVASGTNAFAKEMAIRRRIASMLRKRSWFMIQDMIVNLAEGIDVPAIEARITQYQRDNAEQIMNAQARKAEEYAAALAASEGQLSQMGVDVPSISQAVSSISSQGLYEPAITGAGISQPRPTGVAPQPIPLGSGHDMLGLDYEDEEQMKLKTEKAARAGGWSMAMSRKRTLVEAFASVWI